MGHTLHRLDVAHDGPVRTVIQVRKTLKGGVVYTKRYSFYARRFDVERAETFFNSITRKLLATVGIDRDVEFFYPARAGPPRRSWHSTRSWRSAGTSCAHPRLHLGARSKSSPFIPVGFAAPPVCVERTNHRACTCQFLS